MFVLDVHISHTCQFVFSIIGPTRIPLTVLKKRFVTQCFQLINGLLCI